MSIKIAESERSQQDMNLMPGGGGTNYEIIQPQPSQPPVQPYHENRNYFQVDTLQPNHSYPRQDQMALQLV